MKNILTAVTLGLLSACTTSAPAYASSLEEVFKSTIKIGDANRPFCSAVAVSPTQAITAGHCVDSNLDDIQVKIEVLDDDFETLETKSVYMKTLRYLKDLDIAFVEIKGDYKFETYADIATEAEADELLKIGTPVKAVGYPMAEDLTVTEGVYTGFIKAPIDMIKGGMHKTTIPITGGNSGGALISEVADGDYKVFGLASLVNTRVSFMSFFTSTDAVQKAMVGLLDLPKDETSNEKAEGVRDEKVMEGMNWYDLINPEDYR